MSQKILAVSHDAYFYGAQRSFVDSVLGMREGGFEVHVAVPARGPLTEQLDRLGFKIVVLDYQRWIPGANCGSWKYFIDYLTGLPGSLKRISKILSLHHYSAVYTNTVTVIDFAIAAKIASIPHLWHIRESVDGNTQLKSPFKNAYISYLLRLLSSIIIFNSNGIRRRYFCEGNDKAEVIYNGVEQYGGSARRESGDDLVLVTVGYMDRRKGLDILLDALDSLDQGILESLKLKIVGDIDPMFLQESVNARLAKLKNRTAIEMIGWVPNAVDEMSRGDVLVSTARDEPFGRVIIEAMMLGKAVIATDSGGPAEIIDHHSLGILVPNGDVRGVASAIRQLFEDRLLLQKIGEAGRVHVRTKFTLSSYKHSIAQTVRSVAC